MAVVDMFPPDGERRVVPARLTIALNAKELYGDQVDILLGLWEPPPGDSRSWEPGTAIDRMEAGTLEPTAEEIDRISALTGMSPEYFYFPIEIGSIGPVFACDRSRRKHGLTICMGTVDDRGVLHERYVQPSRGES